MQLGARSRPALAGRARYLLMVLPSRPVCRAIAAFVQPRAASACISTSSSWVNIPHGPPHSSWLQEPVTVRGTPDRTARTRQGTTAGSALRASPTAAPRRVSSRPVRVGNFGDQIRGENRDRGHSGLNGASRTGPRGLSRPCYCNISAVRVDLGLDQIGHDVGTIRAERVHPSSSLRCYGHGTAHQPGDARRQGSCSCPPVLRDARLVWGSPARRPSLLLSGRRNGLRALDSPRRSRGTRG